jgi:hypothetical protein
MNGCPEVQKSKSLCSNPEGFNTEEFSENILQFFNDIIRGRTDECIFYC